MGDLERYKSEHGRCFAGAWKFRHFRLMLYVALLRSRPFQGWNFVGVKLVAVVFRGESFAHGWCGIVRLCSWLNFEKCDFYMNST